MKFLIVKKSEHLEFKLALKIEIRAEAKINRREIHLLILLILLFQLKDFKCKIRNRILQLDCTFKMYLGQKLKGIDYGGNWIHESLKY